MILFDNEALECIKKVAEKVYKSVAHTLGPNGSNSLILKNNIPIITNDGVSIINSIMFEKEEENLILSLIKDGISNTESKVGDGTTSTMILLYNIIVECLNRINKSEKTIELRNKLLKELKIVLKEIPKYSTPITKLEDIKNIAMISSGGYEKIAQLLLECFQQTNSINIELDENNDEITSEKITGLIINSKSLIKKEKMELESKILIILDNSISPEDLKTLMELKRQKDFPLLLFIGKVNEEINNLLNLYSRVDNLFIYSLPEFGNKRNDMIKALSFLTKSEIINTKNYISRKALDKRYEILGNFKGIISDNNIVLTELSENDKNILKEKLPYKKEELEKGVIKIKIGAPTELQAKELYYRIEDSINSINKSLEKGFIPGAGSILYYISNNCKELDILKNPLKSITHQLINNNGLYLDYFEEKLKEQSLDYGFNAITSNIDNLKEKGIIDPTITIMSSIENAVNIASSIITIKNINLTK